MRSKIDDKSAAQGFPESRLPHFTAEESDMIKGSADFLGLNIYTSFMVYAAEGNISDVKTGDVIVFNNAKRKSDGSFRYGKGHLSFIVGVEPDGSILALGGNQGGGKKVTVTRYSPDIVKKYYKGGFTVRRIDELGLNQTDPAILAEITKSISQGTAER